MSYRSPLLACALLLAGSAQAQAPAPAAAREIAQLFTTLQNSHCAFARNGTWYDAEQASAHLHEKYDYLVKRGLVTNAETFIERAATKSSLTGRSYLVRCGQEAPVPSGAWLASRLKELREHPAH